VEYVLDSLTRFAKIAAGDIGRYHESNAVYSRTANTSMNPVSLYQYHEFFERDNPKRFPALREHLKLKGVYRKVLLDFGRGYVHLAPT
jgi:hypothetical protein